MGFAKCIRPETDEVEHASGIAAVPVRPRRGTEWSVIAAQSATDLSHQLLGCAGEVCSASANAAGKNPDATAAVTIAFSLPGGAGQRRACASGRTGRTPDRLTQGGHPTSYRRRPQP